MTCLLISYLELNTYCERSLILLLTFLKWCNLGAYSGFSLKSLNAFRKKIKILHISQLTNTTSSNKEKINEQSDHNSNRIKNRKFLYLLTQL